MVICRRDFSPRFRARPFLSAQLPCQLPSPRSFSLWKPWRNTRRAFPFRGRSTIRNRSRNVTWEKNPFRWNENISSFLLPLFTRFQNFYLLGLISLIFVIVIAMQTHFRNFAYVSIVSDAFNKRLVLIQLLILYRKVSRIDRIKASRC